MGLSASQARLLSLTARLSDLELQAQQISNSKIRLATQSGEAAQKYNNALDSEKMLICSGYNNNGTTAYEGLGYSNLVGPDSPLLSQYCLCDNANKVLVTQEQAKAFKNSNSVEEFCELMGAGYTTSYANGITAEEYAQADAAVNSAYIVYQNAESTLTSKQAALNAYGTTHVDGYSQNGAWSNTVNTDVLTTVGANETEIEDATIYYDPVVQITKNGQLKQFLQQGSSGNYYKLFKGDNIQAYGLYEAGLEDYEGCFITSLMIKAGDDTFKYDADGNLTLNGEKVESDNNYKSLADGSRYYYGNNGELSITAADGDGIVSCYTGTWTPNNDKTLKWCSLDVSDAFANLDGLLGDFYTKNEIMTEDECETYKVSDVDTDAANYQYDYSNMDSAPTYKTVTKTYSSTEENPTTTNIRYLTSGNETTDSVSTEYETLLAQYQSALATRDETKSLYEIYKTYFESLGGPIKSKSENTDYYTNLYNKMLEGYFTTDNEDATINKSEWVQDQLQNYNLILNKFSDEDKDGTSEWASNSWSTNLDIVTKSDDSKIAKAEAQYESELASIQSKDKRFDLELANIDTEHTSIQTEIDTVKKVINKNVDRSFKIFDA